MAELANLAVVKSKHSYLLGHLMWYSVGKQLTQTGELERKLAEAGLDLCWMPKAIRSPDAFRRATKELEQRKTTTNPDVFENVLVREVFSDATTVQRNLVIESVDQHGKRLSYDAEAAIITLDKKQNRIASVVHTDAAHPLCQEAERKFDVYKNHYAAQQIRVMVSRILQYLAPTPVRKNGGIYFVPSSKTMDLSNLVGFISSLENSEGYKIPVIDTTDNRQMVNDKLAEHLQSVLEGCRNREGLKRGQVKELVDEANTVIKNYRNYKTIIREQSEQMEETILMIRSEMNQLLREIT
ncbi:DUF6744 family protein [Virgibacillus xinjiangensis]|uniref:DUF6744 family protein n=1 Tax=Virgibacillus xinjiangensis TaxID=393090 RepID=A0ABV7CYR5_9BACI